jgi:hypothetical protein
MTVDDLETSLKDSSITEATFNLIAKNGTVYIIRKDGRRVTIIPATNRVSGSVVPSGASYQTDDEIDSLMSELRPLVASIS